MNNPEKKTACFNCRATIAPTVEEFPTCDACDRLAGSYEVPESWCWDGQTEDDW